MTNPELVTSTIDAIMILWLMTIALVLKCGRDMADQEIMFGAVAVATVSVVAYTIFRF